MTDLWEEHSLFPMFWIEEFADLNDEYKDTLDDMLLKPFRIIEGVKWTMVGLNNSLLKPTNVKQNENTNTRSYRL